MVATLSLVLALAQTGATLQQNPQPPAPQPAVMMPGPTVFVLDESHKETKGRLLRLDAKEVVILVDGTERRFDLSRVRRVQKRGDSLKNGAIAGAIVGVLGGIGASQTTSDAGGGDLMLVLGGVAIYSAIGTGIDALIQGRTTLYQAVTVTAALGPAMGSGAKPAVGMSLRVSW